MSLKNWRNSLKRIQFRKFKDKIPQPNYTEKEKQLRRQSFFGKDWNLYWLIHLKELTLSCCFETNRYPMGMWEVLVGKTGCFLLITGKTSTALLGLLWQRQTIEEERNKKNQRSRKTRLTAKDRKNWVIKHGSKELQVMVIQITGSCCKEEIINLFSTQRINM